MSVDHRAETAERPLVRRPAPPLGPLGSVVVLAVGLLLAAAAVMIANRAVAGSGNFRAEARLAIAMPEAGGKAGLAKLIASGSPTKAATTVLADPQLASRATAGATGSPTISVTATPGVISVTVTANSAATAERVAQAMVDADIPVVAPTIEPLRLVEIGSPAGTAVPAGLPVGVVAAVAAPAGFMLGLLIALVARGMICRRTTRSTAGPGSPTVAP
jgi:hypothetical protein